MSKDDKKSPPTGGMHLRVDELGRVTIPKQVRDAFGLAPRDIVEATVKDHRLVLTKFYPQDALEPHLDAMRTILEALDGSEVFPFDKAAKLNQMLKDFAKELAE